jgi:hypothetical protein
VSRSILNFSFRLCCLLIVSLMATQYSKAQEASDKSSGITVTVSQQVKINASKLRLLLPIRVETRDGSSVLKTMKNHQEAVRKELKSFGVDDSAIEFSSPLVTAGIPGVDDPDASRKAARSQVIQMRNMNPHMKAQYPVPSLDDEDDSELPIVYAAEATLLVDWKIEKQSEEAAILLPSKVKRLYEQKDLAGKKFRVELTDVEQSLVEPLLGSTNYISYPAQASGNNRLFYVGEVSPEQEKAAFAEAVKKAKGQAELIAQGSGLRLGKIRSILTSNGGDFTSLQANLYMAMRSDTADGKLREKNDREVASADMDGLKKQIYLVVVFDFE